MQHTMMSNEPPRTVSNPRLPRVDRPKLKPTEYWDPATPRAPQHQDVATESGLGFSPGRMTMMHRLMYTAGAIATVLTLAHVEHAQGQHARPGFAVSVVGGASSYDLSGVGTAAVLAVRAEIPAVRHIVVEPGLGYFRYADQSGTTTTYLLPEVSVQIDPLRGALRPYLGVGGGGAAVLTGGSGSELSLHAAAGLRVRLTSAWALMGEFRVRTIDPLHGTTADYTGGVSLRI